MKIANKNTPKNKVWIAGLCSDSFNYFPTMITVKQAKKIKERGYRKEKTAQRVCDQLNSM